MVALMGPGYVALVLIGIGVLTIIAVPSPPTEWRVTKDDDGQWCVEVDHVDQGWVPERGGFHTMIDAAAFGRRRFDASS